eukprot:UN02781
MFLMIIFQLFFKEHVLFFELFLNHHRMQSSLCVL